MDYEGTAGELVERLLKLIPDNPSILKLTDPWALFKIPGFKCDDLNPSMFQAGWALGRAKVVYENRRKG